MHDLTKDIMPGDKWELPDRLSRHFKLDAEKLIYSLLEVDNSEWVSQGGNDATTSWPKHLACFDFIPKSAFFYSRPVDETIEKLAGTKRPKTAMFFSFSIYRNATNPFLAVVVPMACIAGMTPLTLLAYVDSSFTDSMSYLITLLLAAVAHRSIVDDKAGKVQIATHFDDVFVAVIAFTMLQALVIAPLFVFGSLPHANTEFGLKIACAVEFALVIWYFSGEYKRYVNLRRLQTGKVRGLKTTLTARADNRSFGVQYISTEPDNKQNPSILKTKEYHHIISRKKKIEKLIHYLAQSKLFDLNGIVEDTSTINVEVKSYLSSAVKCYFRSEIPKDILRVGFDCSQFRVKAQRDTKCQAVMNSLKTAMTKVARVAALNKDQTELALVVKWLENNNENGRAWMKGNGEQAAEAAHLWRQRHQPSLEKAMRLLEGVNEELEVPELHSSLNVKPVETVKKVELCQEKRLGEWSSKKGGLNGKSKWTNLKHVYRIEFPEDDDGDGVFVEFIAYSHKLLAGSKREDADDEHHDHYKIERYARNIRDDAAVPSMWWIRTTFLSSLYIMLRTGNYKQLGNDWRLIGLFKQALAKAADPRLARNRGPSTNALTGARREYGVVAFNPKLNKDTSTGTKKKERCHSERAWRLRDRPLHVKRNQQENGQPCGQRFRNQRGAAACVV